MKRILILLPALLLILSARGAAVAQTSASYKLTESTINAGGDPQNGSFAASASYRIELDAIGQGLTAVGLSSASFHLDDGFVDAYSPPREVLNLRWTDASTLAWNPEPSVGVYELYRDLASTLPGGFGTCFQSAIVSETWTDASVPSPGTGWFYLVTARNRLAEEGTKGFQGSGLERPNPSPCP
jgi:hypothetical protein